MTNPISRFPFETMPMPSHSLKLCFLLLVLLAGGSFLPGSAAGESHSAGESPPAGEAPPAAKKVLPNPAVLWQQAETALKGGDLEKASVLYQSYYEDFRETTTKAEEALWQAAQASKLLSQTGKTPDWERVSELFRLYTIDYPRSPRAAEAYLEIGASHYQMRRLREALTYFKLFGKKYPNSPLAPKVNLLHAETFLLLGKLPEAAELFKQAQKTATDDIQRGKALMGLADTQSAAGDYAGALATLSAIAAQDPDVHLHDPDFLRKRGNTLLAAGKEQEGREALHHYLNLVEKSPFRNEVLFGLAESYRRTGDGITALKLYEWILAGSAPDEWLAVLAKFRQAEYYEDPNRKLPKWQKRIDLTDPSGDKPFQAVLDAHRTEPIAQDARKSLFLRYQARNDFEAAYEIGKNYLRNAEAGAKTGEKNDFTGQILLAFAETFIAKKEYDKLYRLYVDEYRHVSSLNNGRFFLLVGQALEEMGLYEQAAAIYFRAQALPLSDQDKLALYCRRTETYILLKDWAAADRLLVYLRDIYRNTKEIAEIYYLSGRLAEARGAKKDAQDYFGRAGLAPAPPARKLVYGEAQLRMLFALGLYHQAGGVLDQFRRERSLDGEILQDWYRQLGDVLLRSNESQALAAYQAGVGEGLPAGSRAAQQINLQLGELFRKKGEQEKSRTSLGKAQAGTDPLLKKKAQERLNQLEIDQATIQRGAGK